MNKKGLTIVELIVVIAILGIIMTICIPKDRKRDYQLLSNARTLTNDIRYMRYLRMTEGGYYTLIIQEDKYFLLDKTKTIKTVEFGDGIRIFRNFNGYIRFNRNGSPTQSGTITINDVLTKKSYTITIVPATGRVLLQ